MPDDIGVLQLLQERCLPQERRRHPVVLASVRELEVHDAHQRHLARAELTAFEELPLRAAFHDLLGEGELVHEAKAVAQDRPELLAVRHLAPQPGRRRNGPHEIPVAESAEHLEENPVELSSAAAASRAEHTAGTFLPACGGFHWLGNDNGKLLSVALLPALRGREHGGVAIGNVLPQRPPLRVRRLPTADRRLPTTRLLPISILVLPARLLGAVRLEGHGREREGKGRAGDLWRAS
mmetsp:Transcript_17886/g.37997  ORF Transcript_17886/g.37997 Transcript_17886/m.37997 type:complete len:237 (+) Transcript_17886:2344-3054(+)